MVWKNFLHFMNIFILQASIFQWISNSVFSYPNLNQIHTFTKLIETIRSIFQEFPIFGHFGTVSRHIHLWCLSLSGRNRIYIWQHLGRVSRGARLARTFRADGSWRFCFFSLLAPTLLPHSPFRFPNWPSVKTRSDYTHNDCLLSTRQEVFIPGLEENMHWWLLIKN